MADLLSRIRAKSAKSWTFGGTGGTHTDPSFWALNALQDPGQWGVMPGHEELASDFQSYIHNVYKASGPVFSAILARQHVFSEARFAWQRIEGGRPQDLFGNPDLALLETPWPNGDTGSLLARMEVNDSLAGNFYATHADDRGRWGKAAIGGPGHRVAVMRPDWVSIIIGTNDPDNPWALDAKVVGYQYTAPGQDPVILTADETCHYFSTPDPDARFRGQSWVTPVLREIGADIAATKHKGKFFTNGATPNMAIKFDKDTSPTAFKAFVEKFNSAQRGVDKAYKTLFLTGGADVTPLAADFRQLDFANTQGKGETRIAMAARVHPAILGASEGMQGATLNEGNFRAAKRNFVDGTMRALWRYAAASLQVLVPMPAGQPGSVRLWYDDRDIAFLREDRKDQAEIQGLESRTIRSYTDAGFTPESVVAAVAADDIRLLKHSGLFSVQLQPPGTTTPESEPATESEPAPDTQSQNGQAPAFTGVN